MKEIEEFFFLILIILYQFELGFFTHVCAVWKIYEYEYSF